MRKYTKILVAMIMSILLLSGCGSTLEENRLSSEKAKVLSSKMNIKNEIVIQEEKVEEEKKDLEILTDEEEEKSPSVERVPPYTTEEISGDFMSTVSLNMREGPSTDFKLVGTLQPYVKAVASEKTRLNGSTWYKITTNDMIGWAAENYLVAYKKSETPVKEPETVTVQKQTTPTKQENKPKEKPKEEPKKEPEKEPKKEPEKEPKKEAPKEEPKEEPKEVPKEIPKEKPSSGAAPSAVEKAVIDLTNAERKKAGLAPYQVDSNLVASARAKSKDMAAKGYFDHHSPTYGSIDKQLGQFGVSFRGWGENIAKGQKNAEEVVTAWMNSPGHKENILNPKMTHIGVGFDANGNHWTQQFIYK